MDRDSNFLVGLSSYFLTLGLIKRFSFNKLRYDQGLPDALQQALHYCEEAISTQRIFLDTLHSLDDTEAKAPTIFLLSTQIQDALYKCHHAFLEHIAPDSLARLIEKVDSLRSFWSDNKAKKALLGKEDVWDFEYQLNRTIELESAILERLSDF